MLALMNNEALNSDEKKTIEDSIQLLSRLQRNYEVTYDFQGWKEKPLKFSEVLDSINALDENGKVKPEILNTNVIILEDDGMGYGANNGACRQAYVNKEGEINLWF